MPDLTLLKNRNAPEATNISRSSTSTILLFLGGLFGIAAGVYLLWDSTSVKSQEAVINGRIISINAPRYGLVKNLDLKTRDFVRDEQVLFDLVNRNLDISHTERIKTEITQAKLDITNFQTQAKETEKQLNRANSDRVLQRNLEVQKYQADIRTLQSSLQRAREEYSLAKITYDRRLSLLQEGAISAEQVDIARTEMNSRQAQIQEVQRQIIERQTNLEAAKNELTIMNTRSNSDPSLRTQELSAKLQELQQQIKTKKVLIRQLETELNSNREGQVLPVIAPFSGLVWTVKETSGTEVLTGQKILELLDCSERWLDVYVNESQVRRIRVDQPVMITLTATGERVEGTVEYIRSGLGRLRPGEDVLQPIEAKLQKQAQVRVKLKPQFLDRAFAANFCHVGFTGSVRFEKK